MTPGRRSLGVRTLALVASLAVLGACAPGSTARGLGPVSPQPVTAELHLPSEPTTLVDAATSSAALFTSAPVVVLVDAADPDAQVLAASVAVTLGVPVLLADATGTWQEETARLGTRTVLAIGEVDTESDPALDVVACPDADSLGALLQAPVVEAPSNPVAALATVDADIRELWVPVPTDASTTEPDPAGAGTTDTDTPTCSGPDVPRIAASTPVPGGILVSDGDPDTIVAVANARAAGQPVVVVPEGDPRATAQSVTAIAASADADSHILAAGPQYAALGADVVDWQVRTAATGTQLPAGGQLVFEDSRLVALYGTPGMPALGLLGEQDLPGSIERVNALTAKYQALTDDTVVPAFEIIATIADRDAGADGDYSNERTVEDLRPWVEAAQDAGVLVILDLQPGRTDFLTQAQRYRELLEYPNVGLALDPEWRLGPNQVHLAQIGSADAAELNAVGDWLAELVRTEHLPQKVFVIHQFASSMIRNRQDLDTLHPELAMVLHVDGQGGQPAKNGTWQAMRSGAPEGLYWGWKNFIDEDHPMLTPQQTYRVDPLPDLVTYQ